MAPPGPTDGEWATSVDCNSRPPPASPATPSSPTMTSGCRSSCSGTDACAKSTRDSRPRGAWSRFGLVHALPVVRFRYRSRADRAPTRPRSPHLMDLLLKEEHHQVRETARKFADEVVAPQARELDEKEEFPTDIVRQMAELGFMGLPYPEKYGGAGLDMLAYVIAVEEIARACGSTAITL